MNIPSNITKEHLLKAIEKIDKEGIPNRANSQYYDVIYNNKKYPPKLIVSFANIYANGSEIDRNSFKGGKEEECFKLLQKNDFEIVSKSDGQYFDELLKFISIANEQTIGSGTTDSARIFIQNSYHQYKGFKVDISFGIGRASRIPWISFLGKNQTTSNGIYPVILYYVSNKILILAYGISEKNIPILGWNLPIFQTVKEYFESNKLGLPEKYGSSYVYKAYNLNIDTLNQEETESNISEILKIYGDKLSQKDVKPMVNYKQIPFDCSAYFRNVKESGLSFSNILIQRFIASLCTKPFIICSGLSGSGKTKLAQAFVQWICESDMQYKIIPVGADWTNREPLLGYPNGLDPKSYVTPDSGALQLILEAAKVKNQSKPFFMILDEMNLSHVERYFADFLSIMESKEKLKLYSGEKRYTQYIKDNEFDEEYFIPYEIEWPTNLFIIGTVNIDETTYMFSPKVLDRANVIEFRITDGEIKEFLDNPAVPDLKKLNSNGIDMAASFLSIATKNDIVKNDTLGNELVGFFQHLNKVGAEFGYRTASEIMQLVEKLKILEPKISDSECLDIAIMQKLLPKLHGSRSKLVKILIALAGICVDKSSKAEYEKNFENLYSNSFQGITVKYPISFEKLIRMYKNVLANGFTSYAEA